MMATCNPGSVLMGGCEYTALTHVLTGNYGLFVGLILCAFGFYQIMVARSTMVGIIAICMGLLIPFLPNFMGGLQSASCPIIEALGGQCANFVHEQNGWAD